MATDAPLKTQTPPPAESKSARKKKAKAEAAVASSMEPPRSYSQAGSETPHADANGNPGGYENVYIRETQKHIRNVNKKLNSMSKLDQIIAENPGVSLDELVHTRKINADQKAQALKKPALQQQLQQLEEQLSTYKKIDDDYQAQLTKEKELFQSKHTEELEKLREVVVAEQTALKQKEFKMKLLSLSRFLAAAANRRNREEIAESEESKAFEGALGLVYMATPDAVAAAEKLIEGSDDQVLGQDGVFTSITYHRIRELYLEETASEDPFDADAEPAAPGEDDAAVETHLPPTSDPTITNAGLTELDTAVGATNGEESQVPLAPPNATIGEGVGNETAEEQWDAKPGADDPLAESFEMVPRDPSETETREQPTAVAATQSWADDHPGDIPTEASQSWASVDNAAATARGVQSTSTHPAATPNGSDGFHEVHHGSRGRGPRPEYRGRGRGDFRGRGRGGPRGEFRGRGRGGPRGERGNHRGGRGGAGGEAGQQ